MELKRARSVIVLMWPAGVAAIFLGALASGVGLDVTSRLLIGSGIVLLFGAAAMTAKFWRCPNCGSQLPYRGYNALRISYCPDCGEKLDL